MEKVDILGIKFDNSSLLEVLDSVQTFLSSKEKHYIVTPNPEFIIEARSDKRFQDILNKADLSITDGVGVVLAGWILGKRFKERVTGVVLVNALLFLGAEKVFFFFFWGGGEGVAERAAEKVQTVYT